MKKTKNTKRKIRIISSITVCAVILFIFLLLEANYYVGNSHKSQEASPTPTPAFPSPTAQPPSSTAIPTPFPPLGQIPPTSLETLNTWKRYTNTKY